LGEKRETRKILPKTKIIIRKEITKGEKKGGDNLNYTDPRY
jgi:hypothetical protein